MSPIPHFADSPEKSSLERGATHPASEGMSSTQDVSSTDSGVGNSIADSADQPDNVENHPESGGLPPSAEGGRWLDISTKDEAYGGHSSVSYTGGNGGLNTTTPIGSGPVGMEPLPRDCSSNDLASWQQNNLATIAQVNADECGTPLDIFSKVNATKVAFVSYVFDKEARTGQ